MSQHNNSLVITELMELQNKTVSLDDKISKYIIIMKERKTRNIV